MSLSQMAKKFCSNYFNGDCCMSGIPCLICNGLPCRFFKDVVWKEFDPSYRYSHNHHVYERNLEEFMALFCVEQTAKARSCECGAVLAKRRRFCDDCAAKNRRASYRKSKSKSKKTG